MDEFNNRMDKQRQVLELVNSKHNGKEELYGLSKKAIERWLQLNGISFDDNVVTILFNISDKLFFLATKSQEQITEEYKNKSLEINELLNQLLIVLP